MAALVSHAMRRYPLSPPDGVYSYNLRVDSNSSWSQSPPLEEGESALSRSMRYADPWLYGSVRGAPPGSVVLAPAFVLCSCPDYLNGTKKGAQKKGQAVCKKCKGTRVLLSPQNGSTKFGTVRCYPTSSSGTTLHSVNSTSQVRGGTVRVTSSTRPSILPASADPYDLMRRSRLNATSEPTSPFRARSSSPSKRSKGSARVSGRRSILECDINPYELMSTEAGQPAKDSSITFVNGQRIRVRPPAPDPDYEDVDENQTSKPRPKNAEIDNLHSSIENAIKSPRPKPNRVAPDPPPVSPLTTNDLDCRSNGFKSILKKTTNFTDGSVNSSRLTRPKTGSHFYIPLPRTPRKKVQFLVDNSEQYTEECVHSAPEYLSEYEDVETYENSVEYPEVFEEKEPTSPEGYETKMCSLRRSTSERFRFEPQKVVFLDTMALRPKVSRQDLRDAFNKCDLEKLDGLIAKRKISPRPKSPPPQPPSQDFENKFNGQNGPTGKSTVIQNGTLENECQVDDVERTLNKKIMNSMADKNLNNSKQRCSNLIDNTCDEKATKEQTQKMLVKELVRKISDSLCTCGLESSTDCPMHTLSDKSLNQSTIESIQIKNSPKNVCEGEDITTNIAKTNGVEENKPQAPPRKRSNNKQPQINVQVFNNLISNDLQETKVKQTRVSLENTSDHEKNESFLLKQKDNKVHNLDIHQKTEDLSAHMQKEIAHLSLQNICVSPKETIENKTEQVLPIESQVITEKEFLSSNINLSKDIKNDDYFKKTIVQISPSHSVHKIQIKNEFPEVDNVQTISILDNAQRKTSIMINGDDCYSTVNVSDDVPLYQSSVVVRDHVPKFNRRSSSVYITGSFQQQSPNTNENDKNENSSGNLNHTETGNNKYSSTNQTKDEKTLKLFTENRDLEKNEINCCVRPSTPDMLREILKDPVEAVKRNLVPHICGKSDVPRRPRDLKPKNYYPLFSLKELTPEALNSRENLSKDVERPLLSINNFDSLIEDDKDACSEHSSSTQYEFVDPGSDCYTDHSNRSSVTEEELTNRTKFYELLADSALLEVSENEDHHYECINRNDTDPIYEEIEIPPPLPSNPPPSSLLDDLKLDKEFTTRSIFEGASKYDILSYLVDAKERGIVPEDSYTFSSISADDSKDQIPKVCHISSVSDSSEDNSLFISGALGDDKSSFTKSSEVERNDSGVGSETSKSSLSKYRSKPVTSALCEDCEAPLEALGEDEPLLCRKCFKKRCERKEIIMEIVETEEKYSRDLQIILEEFYQPMLVAGLLTPEQLSTIFLNVEELLENSQSLAERLRDAVEITMEQGDEDLLTVNIGKLFLEAAPMLHAFETYCVRQGPASLLLASLEKEKELLRIFLRVSQMENTLLRRMNLNSFLMVPVQRVTKYPLLLARLYKVTPNHHEAREQLKEAQHKIELHLNHMNSQTKDVPSKLWRRIGSSSGRRPSTEMDLVNIKLRKIAVDVLEWNHEEAKFALEGKLWFTQPTDNNWRKGRTIKLSPVNALLVINGKTTNTNKLEREDNALIFPKHSPTREAALLLVRDKNGRYSLLRDPLYLDRCVIASDPAWQSYFEVQELLGKDTFIFKAEGEDQTKIWYQQLQFHAQGMGAWRKRRNALANIMMNGMGLRL